MAAALDECKPCCRYIKSVPIDEKRKVKIYNEWIEANSRKYNEEYPDARLYYHDSIGRCIILNNRLDLAELFNEQYFYESDDFTPPILTAIETCNVEMVDILVKNGYNVKKSLGRNTVNILTFTIRVSNNVSDGNKLKIANIFEILISTHEGKQMAKQMDSWTKRTPLSEAILLDQMTIVKLLT